MSCTIYLVRHGIAGPPGAGMSDSDRTLTPEGRRKVTRIARALKRLGVKPDAVLTSPLKRADETAQLLIAGLVPGGATETVKQLAPGNSPAEVAASLQAYRGRGSLMLVGHEPDMGYLVSQLLSGSSTVVTAPMKKAGVAAIRVSSLPPRSPGTLLWLMTPKQLRLIGRRD